MVKCEPVPVVRRRSAREGRARHNVQSKCCTMSTPRCCRARRRAPARYRRCRLRGRPPRSGAAAGQFISTGWRSAAARKSSANRCPPRAVDGTRAARDRLPRARRTMSAGLRRRRRTAEPHRRRHRSTVPRGNRPVNLQDGDARRPRARRRQSRGIELPTVCGAARRRCVEGVMATPPHCATDACGGRAAARFARGAGHAGR